MSCTVGIVGAGQLARMLALAGIPLGLRFAFLDPAPDACAARLGKHWCAAYDDREALEQLAKHADVVTYEFENVDAKGLDFLAEHVAAFPSVEALSIARDRVREKTLFRSLEIPSAPFAAIDGPTDLARAAEAIGFPAILKTRTLGYDGKGQVVLQSVRELDAAWARLGGVPAILEGFVQFEREVSIVAVRSRSGETAFYPLSENVHRGGILRVARSRPGDTVEQHAKAYALRLLDRLQYVGVLALELFDTGSELLANEIAPRVHNSGHWTIEGAQTSQFENHLRAILGWPLGSTAAVGASAMVNFIGALPDASQVLAVPGAHLHIYEKEPRSGRKIGHASLRCENSADLERNLDTLMRLTDMCGDD